MYVFDQWSSSEIEMIELWIVMYVFDQFIHPSSEKMIECLFLINASIEGMIEFLYMSVFNLSSHWIVKNDWIELCMCIESMIELLCMFLINPSSERIEIFLTSLHHLHRF